MPDPNRVALIILTAGRSSRMGEPKALLRFGNRTALQLAVQNAIDAGVHRVITVLGHRAEEIRAAHSFSGLPLHFEWAVNFEEDSPMLVSLQLGLERLVGLGLDAFLFQPVDLPLVTARDLRILMDTFAARREEASVFVPSHEQRAGHPVLCATSLLDDFLKLDREATARDVIRKQTIGYVETGNPGVVEDMDTRDDYVRLRKIYDAGSR